MIVFSSAFGQNLAAGAVLLLIAIAVGFILWFQERRRRKRLFRFLREDFGKKPETEWTAEEFESIYLYTKEHSDGRFAIDETTWNDIDGDRLFLQMDHALSSAGDDVLMSFLRLPSFSQKELTEREKLISFFEENEAERDRIRFRLALYGRRIRMSQYAYIRQLETADPVNVRLYILLACVSVLNIALFFISPMWAVLLLVANMAYSFTKQTKNNETIRLYLIAFSSILQLLSTAEQIAKTKEPFLAPYAARLKKDVEALQPFRTGSFLVTSPGGEGGLGDAVLEYIKTFFHVDMLKFNQMLRIYREKKEEVEDLYGMIGTIDAAQAAASWRRTLPYYTRPVFSGEENASAVFRVTEMIHPLVAEPVANSFTAEGGNLITGSNASGKSTFLKNAAICAIFAQSVHTVPAKEYEADFLKVLSSMALSDDLAKKESYFIVELKSIQRILTECGKEGKVLCLIDEVLRGTNTVERIAASSEILRALLSPNVIVLAATHDIELTYLLEGDYRNFHFEEEVTEDTVRFDYKIREGRAVSRNAIALLRVMGFPEKITEKAARRAEHFDRYGKWEKDV